MEIIEWEICVGNKRELGNKIIGQVCNDTKQYAGCI